MRLLQFIQSLFEEVVVRLPITKLYSENVTMTPPFGQPKSGRPSLQSESSSFLSLGTWFGTCGSMCCITRTSSKDTRRRKFLGFCDSLSMSPKDTRRCNAEGLGPSSSGSWFAVLMPELRGGSGGRRCNGDRASSSCPLPEAPEMPLRKEAAELSPPRERLCRSVEASKPLCSSCQDESPRMLVLAKLWSNRTPKSRGSACFVPRVNHANSCG